MITREELLNSNEFWTEVIQNRIYSELMEFIDQKGISNQELAACLGISKGRVSQILSGRNLNFRLDTLVKLFLCIGKVPDFKLENIEDRIHKETGSKGDLMKKLPGSQGIRIKQAKSGFAKKQRAGIPKQFRQKAAGQKLNP